MTTDTVEKVTPSEISEVKVYIHEQMNAFRAEMNSKFDVLRQEVNSKFAELDTRFAEVDSKFDVLHKEMIKHFRWTIGIIAMLVGPTMGVNPCFRKPPNQREPQSYRSQRIHRWSTPKLPNPKSMNLPRTHLEAT